MHEPEPETIRRAQRGDTDAFEDLVRAYLGDVHRWTRHVVRDEDLAQDVTQDTFLKAYRALPSFKWRSKFSTWLFTIARNCAIEATRTRSRLQHVERVRPIELEPIDPSTRIALNDALDALPHELRELFVAIEVFGFSYPEASVVLGIPVGTIKSRMHRTRLLLIGSLSEEDAGEM